MAEYIISSGETISGLELHYSYITVLDGGTVNETTILDSTTLAVSSGGTANSTGVGDDGSMFVYSSGTANNTDVRWGSMYVRNGGMANSTTVNGFGSLTVSSGGTANSTTVNAGYLEVSSGGTANSTTVNSGGFLYISSGGTANGTTINADGWLYVSSGGTANNTNVKVYGIMVVSSGGTANSTTVNAGHLDVYSGGTATNIVWTPCEGYVYVADGGYATFVSQYSGVYYGSGNQLLSHAVAMEEITVSNASMYIMSEGTANSTTVKRGGRLYVSSGGIANSTTVNSSGMLYIYSGGTANNTNVKVYGSMFVSSGGTATNIVWTPCEGYVYVADGGYATFVSQYSGVYYGSGNQLLSHAVAMEEITVSNASMYIMSEGTANSTTVKRGGRLYVSSGGTANSTRVGDGGSMFVYSSGTANNTDVEWGSMYVKNGGMANGTTVNGFGSLTVSSGGTANSTTVNAGYLEVSSGGTANGTTINADGRLYVSSGGIANSTTVNSSGMLYVSSGGTANSTTVNAGHLDVSSGGTATNIVWTPCEGYVYVADGGYATFVSQYSGVYYGSGNQLLSHAVAMEEITVSNASMYIMSEGTANNTTVNSGYLRVHSGGTANSTTVNRFGDLEVSSGGTANSTTVNSSGRLFVSSGGTANSTTVNSSGYLYVSGGGTANSTTVNSSGYLYVSSGGTADNTNVEIYGRLFVSSGGTANNTRVNYYASMYVNGSGTANNTSIYRGFFYVSSGGTANNTSTDAWGNMFVYSDGKLTGRMSFESGAVVSAEAGAILDFNLTGATAGAAALVNDLSIVRGTPTYTITVDEDLSAGIYLLADGTDSFKNTIKMMIPGEDKPGMLSVGKPVEISGVSYTLSLYAGELSLAVGCDPPQPAAIVSSSVVLVGETRDVNHGELYYRPVVSNGGNLNVLEGGSAKFAKVNQNGKLGILDGGMGNNTTVSYGGNLAISGGGTANRTMVVSMGSVFVSSGGTANSTTVNEYGSMFVSFGGTANDTSVNYHGSMFVSFGGTANSTTVTNGGNLTISGGGTANDTTINYSGSFCVSGGGTAKNTVIDSGGSFSVFTGGIAEGINVGLGGDLFVCGGTATDIVWTPCEGHIYVSDGGYATFVSQYSGVYYGLDNQLLSHEIVMEGKSVDSFYEMNVMSGGTANNTILSGGSMFIHSGGTANSTTVEWGGSMYVYRGGTANNTTVAWGSMYVYRGGTADGTVIDSSGYLTVFSGGTATGTTVRKSGKLIVSGGGRLTGRMMFESGASVSAYNGAILDFDLTQTTVGATSLVNDLSIVQGTPIYTLTIDGTQDSGIYRLADGISAFTGVIAVVNTAGEQLGILMVGQKLETEYADYSLKVADDCLTVTVSDPGIIPPAEDTVAPTAPAGLMPIVNGQNVALLWNESTDDISGVKEYIVTYSLDGEIFTARTTIPHYVLKDADYGTWSWSVQAVDFAGNASAVTVGDAFTVTSFKPYTVEYSADNFEHAIRFTVTTPTLNAFRMPGGTYQMRVMATDSAEWMEGDSITTGKFDGTPQLIKSDADGNADVFFANAAGTWETGYLAQHVGSINDWAGTREYASVYGKNKLADIIEGSDDANILLMTDDANGDALFVDDVYTALPGSVMEQQARIAQIDEIRAGAGDDIVDMTSQQFEYIGDGLTIRGGIGNDVIWANKGDNMLFGDAGNDRIVGASGNDVIAGGIGNDRLHGGGGSDVFTFCDNWGTDNVDQLETGSVTLWFASGDKSNWDESTLTYTDGANSVRVSGVAAEQVTLKFGDDGSEEFASLSGMGAFFDATTERIFEEPGKGMLASL